MNKTHMLKQLTWIFLCLGTALVVFGLYIYLMPVNYVGTNQHEEKHEDNFQVPSQRYEIGAGFAKKRTGLRVDWRLNFSVHVQEGMIIDLYVLNETEFQKWAFERETSKWIFFGSGTQISYAFRPVEELTYYFVLDNSPYNETKQVVVDSTFYETYQNFDFDGAINGIKVGIAGLPFLVVGFSTPKQELWQGTSTPLQVQRFSAC